jgi:hypothetical protein
MGRVFRRSALRNDMAPWVYQRFQEMDVDAAFLIPV